MTMTKTHVPFSTIEEANKQLNAILDYSFDGIFITDAEANVLRINHAYEMITGLKRDEVYGKNMADLVKMKLISTSGSLKVMETKKPVTIQQHFKSGKESLITSSPIFDEKGNLIMIVTNVRDLTEIYNLKAVVQEQSETMEHLMSALKHLQSDSKDHKIIAKDENTLATLLIADRVSTMDTSVILLGETGVGKEVIARYIFKHSTRSKGNFVKVNCGAIPENLIESELFGYEGGAFTGANKNGKIGLFELANNGTIFLDEIGELPKDMQVKLLRCLQEEEITRVGGTKSIKINIRVIAATNRNLEEMVKNGDFREDLYYRLTVFPIVIPPLRERRKDIVPLAKFFLNNLNQKYQMKKFFSTLSLQVLQDYSWPGNIRELKNIVERAVIISRTEEITTEALRIHGSEKPIVITVPSPKETTTQSLDELEPEFPIDLRNLLRTIEKQYIQKAYQKYGTVRVAAKNLGMSAATLVRHMKEND